MCVEERFNGEMEREQEGIGEGRSEEGKTPIHKRGLQPRPSSRTMGARREKRYKTKTGMTVSKAFGS